MPATETAPAAKEPQKSPPATPVCVGAEVFDSIGLDPETEEVTLGKKLGAYPTRAAARAAAHKMVMKDPAISKRKAELVKAAEAREAARAAKEKK